jgi:hypothetical protein
VTNVYLCQSVAAFAIRQSSRHSSHQYKQERMGTSIKDLVYAWRTLRRSPSFSLVAILTLGLGIGATTTIFTIVNGVLLRPLPSYREPERIASLWVDFGVGAQSLPAMSPGDFRDYQQRSRSFEMLAAGSGPQVRRRDGRADRAGRRAGERRTSRRSPPTSFRCSASSRSTAVTSPRRTKRSADRRS